MENTQQKLLDLIVQTRQSKKWSRRKLADIADISPTSYNEYEAGNTPFPFDRLLKVLEVLELDIFDFEKTTKEQATENVTTPSVFLPINGRLIEGYFQATTEAFLQMQERLKQLEEDNKEIKELLRNKS